MQPRQIGNAWRERENKEQELQGERERKRVRGVIFWGVQWPRKTLVGFITTLEESLWGLFNLLSKWSSLNPMTPVQAAIFASTYHTEVSVSKTLPAPDAWSGGDSDLWPYSVGGNRNRVSVQQWAGFKMYYNRNINLTAVTNYSGECETLPNL